jgi:sugar diacid utilization regulator
MEWIAFGTVVALAWWCWRRTRERASERKAARERQDLLERNIRLTTTRSLNEAKAEIGTLKDRMSRLTESYKDARTEIATLKKRQITARATAAQATKKKLPSHQGPATPTTRRAPERERCGCRGEVENCHFCFGSGWVGGGYPKY